MASMPRKAVSLVVVLAVFGIIASIGIPIAVDALNTNSSVSLNTTVDETDEVNPNLNATLDSVTAGTDATYTLETAGGESETNTITVDGNATYSFDAGDVVVTVSEAGADYAVASYDYPRDFGFSGSTSALWGLLGLMLVLAAFLYAVYVALDGADLR